MATKKHTTKERQSMRSVRTTEPVGTVVDDADVEYPAGTLADVVASDDGILELDIDGVTVSDVPERCVVDA